MAERLKPETLRVLVWAGVADIVLGIGLTESAQVWGYGALAIGWVLFLTATFLRTRHHKRRMAQGL